MLRMLSFALLNALLSLMSFDLVAAEASDRAALEADLRHLSASSLSPAADLRRWSRCGASRLTL